MPIQLSVEVRNARSDATETRIGPGAILKVRTGPPPTSVAAVDTGTVLAQLTLPADWMNPASGGTKSKAGVWESLAALATGQAGHYRIYEADGVTPHLQGDITATGGGGSMTVADVNVFLGQEVRVTSYTWIEGGA